MCEEWLCPYFHLLVMISAGQQSWLCNRGDVCRLRICFPSNCWLPSGQRLIGILGAASLSGLRWVYRDAQHIGIGACIHERAVILSQIFYLCRLLLR